MRRLLPGLLGLLLLAPAPVAAQSSVFAIRGLGYPGSPYSARARAMGGATALFDPESALNPASVGYLTDMTAAFTLLNDRRSVSSASGSGSVHGMRFPLFSIAGPMQRLPLSFSFGASTYMARDFGVAFADTVISRGVPVSVRDTLHSDGGLSDLRGAVVWRPDFKTMVGGAIHAYTGVTRMDRASVYEDSGYVRITEHAEVSASGAGFDLGVIRRLSARLTVAGVVRSDGSVTVRRDSLASTEYKVDLPVSVAAGLQYRSGSRLLLAAQGRWAGWSSADAQVAGAGGPGAVDTWELGVGGEYAHDPDRPYRLPIRFGVRYARLPFPLVAGTSPGETIASLGSGFLFARGLGGADLTLERAWRGDGGDFSERGWLVTFTASLRPSHRTR